MKNDKRNLSYDAWTLCYTRWDPEQQPLREALCTLGNGLFATRGAFEESPAGGPHYPGTYLGGGYNRLESEVAERIIVNEDLVNWPNWLEMTFRLPDGPWFQIDEVELLEFRQSLHLREGLLERRMRFRHDGDRQTQLVCRRLVHMGDPHLAAIQWEFTPLNWSGQIEISSGLDGSVSNQGVERYRDLSSQHLRVLEMGRVAEDGVWLHVETTQSRLRMAQAARTQVFREGRPAVLERTTGSTEKRIEQRLTVGCEKEKPLIVEKIVTLHTSRDFAISEPALAAREALRRAERFEPLLEDHKILWSQLWNRTDIEIHDGDDWSQMVLRLHIFHLLQTISFNSIDRDVGVPSRGLHGEAYRGHIFWDELFIFPFLNLRIPELTRSLLMYRYRRLPAARQLAADAGYEGAMFPWQSGSSGREESQVVHLNPQSGRWIPDNTHRQRHVNAAIAYNVWQHYETTADIEFLSFYGAEMLLEIARFWASIATYNDARDRFEIHHVVGPDEFHTRYPDSDSLGLNNNAYTNVMAAWTLRCARRALDLLAEDRRQELVEQLGLTSDELERWQRISSRMFVPRHEGNIISQFEGYEQLEELDWEGYRREYGDIQRLDRILEAENDTPNRYKASKQADVLMLFYLFSSEQLEELFLAMGYEFDPQDIPRNIDYYMARTSHGSTLSRVVHSWVLARSDRQQAWRLFQGALQSDVVDIQGGTTQEGIHLGAMAGVVDVLQRCHTGIEIREGVLWLNPCLPEDLRQIRFRLRYQGHWLRLHLSQETLHVTFEHGWSGTARIGFQGEVYEFDQCEERSFQIAGSECATGEPGKD